MQSVKKSDGTIIFDLAVANVGGEQATFQFLQASHTCEELQALFSGATDRLTIVTPAVEEIPETETTPLVEGTPEFEGTPLVNYSNIIGINLVPATTSGAAEDRIYVIMQQLNAAELQKIALKAAVAAGQMTPELYKLITGEDYVA